MFMVRQAHHDIILVTLSLSKDNSLLNRFNLHPIHRFERIACLSGFAFLSAFGFAFLCNDDIDRDRSDVQVLSYLVNQKVLLQ